jgi:hypothetical protein
MSTIKRASKEAIIVAQKQIIQEQEATILTLRSQLSKARAGKRRRTSTKSTGGTHA